MNKPVPAVEIKPAPEKPAPVDPRLTELEKILLELIAKNDAKTLQWEGGGHQFSMTRLFLSGQRETLNAITCFLQGDREAIEKLLNE